jgi:hypothetical protein
MADNPFKKLAERGYRGKPDLEAAVRKVEAEYRQEAEMLQKTPKRDPFWKWIAGIALLIVVFFACYEVVLTRRERALQRTMEGITKQSQEAANTLLRQLSR